MALNCCAYEDRDIGAIGIKLLAISLAEHEPGATLHVFGSRLSPDLQRWLSEAANVVLHEGELPSSGWNVKPACLLHLLDSGLDEVVWVDTDILLTAPLSPILSGHPAETLVVAEDFFTFCRKDAVDRARGWGLPVGRQLPRRPNSCVVRATAHHRDLLCAWQALLEREDYVAGQTRPRDERPFFMVGDQEALSALLASVDFASIPLRFLLDGRDVAHVCVGDGYLPNERVANVWRGTPPVLHSCGPKPWYPEEAPLLYQQLNPYRMVARRYAAQLDASEVEWLYRDSAMARGMMALFRDDPNLAGLPLSAYFLARLFVVDRVESIGRLLQASGS